MRFYRKNWTSTQLCVVRECSNASVVALKRAVASFTIEMAVVMTADGGM